MIDLAIDGDVHCLNVYVGAVRTTDIERRPMILYEMKGGVVTDCGCNVRTGNYCPTIG